MVTECGGIVTHLKQQLQFPAGLAGDGTERGPHAVVTVVKHQYRTLIFARRLPLLDQGGETREPASGCIVIELVWGVIRGRRHPYKIGMEIVGVQDREGLLPVHRRSRLSTQEDHGTGGRRASQDIATGGCIVRHESEGLLPVALRRSFGFQHCPALICHHR
jgi:hypothetical protein